MRRYLVATAVLVGLVGLSVSDGGPRLQAGADGQVPDFGMGAAVTSPDDTRNVFITPLCLSGGDGATVTGVRLLEVDGLTVRDVGLREYPTSGPVSVDPGTGLLADSAFVRSSVTAACGGGEQSMLAVTLSLTGRERGAGRGVAVDYVLDGRPGHLSIPHIALAMCVQPTLEPTCEPPTSDDSDG